MIVYGRNPVREALRGRRRVAAVWATADALRAGLSEAAASAGVGAEEWPPEELERLCGSPEHQGACAETAAFPYSSVSELLEPDDGVVLCLDQVQDPHNLGAVCRVAECAGAVGVVVPERRAAHVSPAVCRASAGAVEHLPVARVGNVTDFLAEAKRRGAWCYGAAASATVSYSQPDYAGRVVLVLGAEGRGIRPRVASACDELVALPIRGRVASLNVATAAAALVYGVLQVRDRG